MAGIMLTEPKALTAANYRLASGSAFYPQRTGRVKAFVVHVTAGLQDLGMSGTDESAEGTNRWALNSGARVSWHRIADSDGVERCLPSTATAWQAKGYNSHTVGEEIANVDAKWGNKPAAWVKWTVWHAALGAADIAVRYHIPLRRATRAELDAAIRNDTAPVGFIDHSRLSDNRIDPGADFPWAMFFTFIRAITAGATHPDRLTPPPAPAVKPPVTTDPQEVTMVLVQVTGTDPVYKSNGFERQHIGKAQLKGLLKAGLKVIPLANTTELDAYGLEVPNPAGVK